MLTVVISLAAASLDPEIDQLTVLDIFEGYSIEVGEDIVYHVYVFHGRTEVLTELVLVNMFDFILNCRKLENELDKFFNDLHQVFLKAMESKLEASILFHEPRVSSFEHDLILAEIIGALCE